MMKEAFSFILIIASVIFMAVVWTSSLLFVHLTPVGILILIGLFFYITSNHEEKY